MFPLSNPLFPFHVDSAFVLRVSVSLGLVRYLHVNNLESYDCCILERERGRKNLAHFDIHRNE